MYLKFNQFILILFVFLSIIIHSCTVAPYFCEDTIRPRIVDVDYSLKQLKQYNEEHYNSIISVINLFEEFNRSLDHSFEKFDSLFINIDDSTYSFFEDKVSNSYFQFIGLEFIEIDTSYFFYADTLKRKAPFFYFFNHPIPLLNETYRIYKPIGPIEDYLFLHCYYGYNRISKSTTKSETFRIIIKPKIHNQSLLINEIKIIKLEEWEYKIPLFLRPVMWFK